MNKLMLLVFIPFFVINSCSNQDTGSIEKWKNEIIEAENNFAAMAEREGIQTAFLHYAAEDAVINRNNTLLIGRAALASYFDEQPSGVQDEHLQWSPDFVDVSRSGDLGYTYGRFTYSYTDSIGSRMESRGIFHTVWKRQEDGSWRFVWD